MNFLRVNAVLTCLVFLFVSSACMEVRNADDPSGRDQDPVVNLSAANAPIVEAMAAANSYRVVFRDVRGSLMHVRRTSTKGKADWVVLPVQNSQAVDADPAVGETVLYEWGEMTAAGFRTLGKANVHVPLDLEIRGRWFLGVQEGKTLSERRHWGRIWFRQGSELITEGEDLILEADRLIFEDSILRSFQKSAKAAVGKNGRSGGRWVLRADQIEGIAHLDLLGEDGGTGFAGSLPTGAMKGRDGLRGQPAQIVKSGNAVMCREPVCAMTIECRTQPGNGQDGDIGLPGFQGQRGGRGGDTPNVLIVARDSSRWKMDLVREPGRGGPGGMGGLGGDGGMGGDAGEIYTPSPGEFVQRSGCLEAQKGRDGQRGPQGATGAPGESGQVQNVCLQFEKLPLQCQ